MSFASAKEQQSESGAFSDSWALMVDDERE